MCTKQSVKTKQFSFSPLLCFFLFCVNYIFVNRFLYCRNTNNNPKLWHLIIKYKRYQLKWRQQQPYKWVNQPNYGNLWIINNYEFSIKHTQCPNITIYTIDKRRTKKKQNKKLSSLICCCHSFLTSIQNI